MSVEQEGASGHGRGLFHFATTQIANIDDLRECLRGANIDVVQLAGGRQQGSLTHFGIDDLEMTLGRFALQVRATGIIHQDRVTLGMLLASSRHVSLWGQDMKLGDVAVIPCGVDLDAIFKSGAAYAAISLPVADLLHHVGYERPLGDPDFWATTRVWSTERSLGEEIARRVAGIFPNLERNLALASTQEGDFLRRTIIEAFVTSLMAAQPVAATGSSIRPLRLVQEVEAYVAAAHDRPVHVSEICTVLGVSRRTLHRAFADTLDTGPASYLRRRRLMAAHHALQSIGSTHSTIADIAFQYGFTERHRFARYYKSMFGQSPSKTRQQGLAAKD
jgi:AraC-like DNA-binding protein